MSKSGLGMMVAVLLACVGCASISPSLALRPEDASASRDFYRGLKPAERTCKRDVPLLSSAEVGGRPYREVSALSATCYPGAPAACERTLANRACELNADALILNESSAGGTPPGASSQSAVSMSARAVNWTDAP